MTTLCTPDAKVKFALVSSDLSERRELVEDGKSILAKFFFFIIEISGLNQLVADGKIMFPRVSSGISKRQRRHLCDVNG